MCLILFSYQPNTDTPLILGANRDEFFERATAPLHIWEDFPNVVAGRDLVAYGTWLGIDQSGRFAAITNVREPGIKVEDPHSRGELTKDFLTGKQSPHAYLSEIESRQHRYAGFNLLVGDFSLPNAPLYYLSNRGRGIEKLLPGTYGLSNHLLDSPWPKVSDGKERLATQLQQAGTDHQLIRQILENPELADDHRLPSTGINYEREKALSATFITLPDYGTRASTVLTIDSQQITFSEQNYQASTNGQPTYEDEVRTFTFTKPLEHAAIIPETLVATGCQNA